MAEMAGEDFLGGDEAAEAAVAAAMAVAALAAPALELVPQCHVLRQGLNYGGSRKPSQLQTAWDLSDEPNAEELWDGDWNWLELMKVRIRQTYTQRPEELCWVYDKLEVKALCDSVAGDAIFMPTLAAWRGGEEEDFEAVRAAVEQDTPLIVKPTHGSEAVGVTIFSPPSSCGGLPAVLAAVEAALAARADRTEPWMLSNLRPGVVVQELYNSGEAACPMAGPPFHCPLELKVQTLFGRIVFGTVRAFPWQVTVLPDGSIHRWASSRVVRSQGLPKAWRAAWGAAVAPAALAGLRRTLASDWPRMVAATEAVARQAGLDEVRVDWMLGDRRLGPRIVELQYVGAAGNLRPELRPHLCRCFLRGHRRRWEEAAAAAAVPTPSATPAEGRPSLSNDEPC